MPRLATMQQRHPLPRLPMMPNDDPTEAIAIWREEQERSYAPLIAGIELDRCGTSALPIHTPASDLDIAANELLSTARRLLELASRLRPIEGRWPQVIVEYDLARELDNILHSP